MKFRSTILSSFVALLALTLSNCPPGGPQTPCPTATPCPTVTPGPTASCEVCINFEAPLVAGTQFGQPVNQAAGTVIFTTNGIPVSIQNFGSSLSVARIEVPPRVFSSGQSIAVNNISLEFDFSGIGFTPTEVRFDFLDAGGTERLSVNGSAMTSITHFPVAANPMGGVNVAVSNIPGGAADQGTVVLLGNVTRVRVGGQELWLDRVCARR